MQAAMSSVVRTIQYIACNHDHPYYLPMLSKFVGEKEKQTAQLLRCVAIGVYCNFSRFAVEFVFNYNFNKNIIPTIPNLPHYSLDQIG